MSKLLNMDEETVSYNDIISSMSKAKKTNSIYNGNSR